jgi:hypothetical protein
MHCLVRSSLNFETKCNIPIERHKRSLRLFPLLLAEILASLLLCSSTVAANQSICLINGFLYSTCFLTIHARVCSCLMKGSTERPRECRPFYQHLQVEFGDTFTLSIYSQLKSGGRAIFPALLDFLELLVALVMLDLSTYGVREYIPLQLASRWHPCFHYILSAIWIMVSLDLNYKAIIIFMDLAGTPLPMLYRYSNE